MTTWFVAQLGSVNMLRPRRTPVAWELFRAIGWLMVGLGLVILLGGHVPDDVRAPLSASIGGAAGRAP